MVSEIVEHTLVDDGGMFKVSIDKTNVNKCYVKIL
jgi:hypothetical protein